MDTQTTSSHAESGDAVVCNDEVAATESAEGGDFLSFCFLNLIIIVTLEEMKGGKKYLVLLYMQNIFPFLIG